MSYTVLARKYRSRTFGELVGQQAVATTLTSAISTDRIHHGYLFTGTRGVGKTSAARILARSLNCLKSDKPTAEPCCECESCIAISEGQDIDVIEIDAASNTGVDNIRELRNNAAYRPARSRFKVYIIDEVHMLSTGAFNALLKTLEEPPDHVKFIMATTEPQKVPATIQSRCLRFDFRSISANEIARHFESILKDEKIDADEQVIRRLSRLANGSMRDGLSLLDQLLAMGRDKLTVEMIDDVLPAPHDEMLTRMIGQIADHDAAGALNSIDEALGNGYSLDRLAESLAEQVRSLMLLHICGADTPLIDVPTTARDEMLGLAGRFSEDSYVYMLTVLEELRRSVRFSALGRPLLEAGIVRLASAVPYRSIQDIIADLGAADSGSADSSKKKVLTQSPTVAADTRPSQRPSPAPSQSPPARSVAPPATVVKPPTSGAEPSSPTRRKTTSPTARRSASPSHPEPKAEPAQAKQPPASVPARSSKPALPAEPVPAESTPSAPVPSPVQPAALRNHKRPPTADEVNAARNEPFVQKALELFDGRMVNAERADSPQPLSEADDTDDES